LVDPKELKGIMQQLDSEATGDLIDLIDLVVSGHSWSRLVLRPRTFAPPKIGPLHMG
jgi:hypothetical protein